MGRVSFVLKRVFIFLAAAAVLVCAFFLLAYLFEEKSVDDEVQIVDDIRDMVVTDRASSDDAVSVSGVSASLDSGVSVPVKKQSGGRKQKGGGSSSGGGVADPLYRMIDFSSLAAINPDATRWLYVPGTNIDYYVMQERTPGETFYLWNNIYRKKSSWGSILMPASYSDLDDDAHQLVFGHHMRSKNVAFSSLSKYRSADYAESHAYAYLYSAGHNERYRIWSCADTTAADKIYDMPYTLGSDSYGTLLSSVSSSGHYTLGDAGVNDRTLVLSTCSGQHAGGEERFYAVFVLDAVYDY